jgi:predicted DNA-binding protein with PD1-like motif
LLTRDFRAGRIILARLDHGEDIIAQITGLAQEELIEMGAFSVIGALSRAEIGYYDQSSHEYQKISVDRPVELANCSGNISLRDGRPFVHAHACLADLRGRVIGGHLFGGTVFAAELALNELLARPLTREHDGITDLYLWGEP